LIEGGGAKYNDKTITDVATTLSANDLTSDGYIKLSAGKKRHALVKAA
jgi:tyrosyl-tRNA synthetase